MSENTVEQIVAEETVVEVLPNITPYYAAKVANKILEGTGRKVTPQMMYTYAKKNTIQTVEDDKGKKYFVGEAFKTWLDKYIKNESQASRADINEMAAKFA
jgi:hypothetical protein